MTRGRQKLDWKYFFRAEDATTQIESRLAGACKTILWLGISILIGVSVGQLS